MSTIDESTRPGGVGPETDLGTGGAPSAPVMTGGGETDGGGEEAVNGPGREGETVRIVLATASGERQLTVSADVPVAELVAALVERYEQDGNEPWVLARADGRLLADDQTLATSGVRDPEQLALIPRHAARRAPVTEPVQTETSKRVDGARPGGPVSERTAAALPAKPGPGLRIAAMWRALFARGGELVGAVPDGHVNPASLAQEPRQSVVRRCLQAGRQAGYEHRLERLINTPVLKRPVVIAIISGKGGVGKTTCASLLASLLAFLRGGRVIAVDANPDFGMLGAMLAPGQGMFIDELLAGPLAKDQLTITELDAALARGPDGLMVCPGPVEPNRCDKLETEDYLRLFERLRQHAGILVLDCGTSFTSKPAKAVLEIADQLVLLADDTMQAAAVAIYAGRWLGPQRYAVTLALNKRDGRGYIDLGKLEEGVPEAIALATIPTDEAAVAQLFGSTRFSWRDDQGTLGTTMRELAALLASDWQRLKLTTSPGKER